MHPVLSVPRRRRLFILLWPVIGAAVSTLPYWWAGGAARDWWLVALWGELLGIPALASIYVCRAAPLATTEAWRLLATIGTAALVVTGLWLEVGHHGFWLASPVAPSPADTFDTMALPAAVAAALTFTLSATIGYALIAIDDRQAVTARVHTAELGARDAELRALRAQVDPHFLFNCLHSISSLIGSDPKSARQMCIDLAAFFRESQRVGHLARISVAEEVELIRGYLAVEQLRFGSRLAVAVRVADDASHAAMPPLLLQPLVENAVKHGIATLLHGGEIEITIERREGRLVVRVDNPYDPDERRPGSGIGLTNVRGRLDAIFGSAASVKATAEGGRFSVEVLMPVEEAA